MQQVSKWDAALRNERVKKKSTLGVQYLEHLRFAYGDICRATARDVDPFSFVQHPSRSETGLTFISRFKYVKTSIQTIDAGIGDWCLKIEKGVSGKW
jgi:hypothetical protein